LHTAAGRLFIVWRCVAVASSFGITSHVTLPRLRFTLNQFALNVIQVLEQFALNVILELAQGHRRSEEKSLAPV